VVVSNVSVEEGKVVVSDVPVEEGKVVMSDVSLEGGGWWCLIYFCRGKEGGV